MCNAPGCDRPLLGFCVPFLWGPVYRFGSALRPKGCYSNAEWLGSGFASGMWTCCAFSKYRPKIKPICHWSWRTNMWRIVNDVVLNKLNLVYERKQRSEVVGSQSFSSNALRSSWSHTFSSVPFDPLVRGRVEKLSKGTTGKLYFRAVRCCRTFLWHGCSFDHPFWTIWALWVIW